MIYPVAQLLMASVRLVPTARYFPLRLRLVKALNKLSQACSAFIPVAPLLLEALQWSGLTKQAKAGGKAPSDAVPQLRAGKQMLETVAYQQSLVEEVGFQSIQKSKHGRIRLTQPLNQATMQQYEIIAG